MPIDAKTIQIFLPDGEPFLFLGNIRRLRIRSKTMKMIIDMIMASLVCSSLMVSTTQADSPQRAVDAEGKSSFQLNCVVGEGVLLPRAVDGIPSVTDTQRKTFHYVTVTTKLYFLGADNVGFNKTRQLLKDVRLERQTLVDEKTWGPVELIAELPRAITFRSTPTPTSEKEWQLLIAQLTLHEDNIARLSLSSVAEVETARSSRSTLFAGQRKNKTLSQDEYAQLIAQEAVACASQIKSLSMQLYTLGTRIQKWHDNISTFRAKERAGTELFHAAERAVNSKARAKYARAAKKAAMDQNKMDRYLKQFEKLTDLLDLKRLELEMLKKEFSNLPPDVRSRVKLVAEQDPQLDESPFIAWAHDITVKSELIFRYRLTLVFVDPVFRSNRFNNNPYDRLLASEWSDPIAIKSQVTERSGKMLAIQKRLEKLGQPASEDDKGSNQKVIRSLTTIFRGLPSEARPDPTTGWDKFSLPKAMAWAANHVVGQEIEVALPIRGINVSSRSNPTDKTQTLAWSVAITFNPVEASAMGLDMRFIVDSRLKRLTAFSVLVDESEARWADNLKPGMLIKLKGRIAKVSFYSGKDRKRGPPYTYYTDVRLAVSDWSIDGLNSIDSVDDKMSDQSPVVPPTVQSKKTVPAQAETIAVDKRKSVEPPKDAIRLGRHAYQLIATRLTWHSARAHCKQLGGHLVAIESAVEQRLVHKLAQRSGADSIWIGGTDEEDEGQWTWVTDTPIRYRHFDRGQPNNRAGEEHHLHLISDSGRWHDTGAGYRTFFVCEWDLDP